MTQVQSDFKTEFAVEMTCESCVKDVTNVLDGAEGVKKFDIDLKEQRVAVEGSGAHSGAAVCILDIQHDDPTYTTIPGGSKPYGLVRFLQVNNETCVVDVTVQGLTPGQHGIYIHELGDTSGGAATCGDHFNPTNVAHGDSETGHVGDLGNIEVDAKGWGDLVLESKRIKVWDIIGRSMVVTDRPDDFGQRPLTMDTPSTTATTETTKTATTTTTRTDDGGSGNGVICGIIARSAGVFENAKKICDCSGTTLWEEARLTGSNDFY
ncbi:hypothetical protein BG004_002457 [Podila humilis]|nr:hypothetical protein BG004_002457 [Podila humilis]